MLNKFLITIVALVATIFAICKMDFTQPMVENFWGGIQFGSRKVPATLNKNGQPVALGVTLLNEQTMGSGKFFQVPPNFQGVLSPRFSNIDYGANIKYNLTDRKNMGVPCEPLTFRNMTQENFNEVQKQPRRVEHLKLGKGNPHKGDVLSKENYGGCANCGSGGCAGGCPPSCGKGGYGFGKNVAGGYELPSNYANGNYWEEYDKLKPVSVNMGSELPVGTMTTMDASGNETQHVTFDRLMYSNRPTSHKYGQGDWIRGDLAIAPCNTGWFSVYPDLARDLNPGAMQVMGGAGAGGESNAKLLQMLSQSSGSTTFAGIDLRSINPEQINMTAQANMQLKSGLSDVSVSAFP